MKKWICLLLAMWVLAVPALADVAWEPENSFYQRHQNQCELEERMYWVNGAEGYAVLQEEPEGKPIATVKNGVKVFVNGIYDDAWALITYNVDQDPERYLAVASDAEEGYHEAWLPMEELVRYYDSQCFEEEHRTELSAERRTFEAADKALCLYEYPGGPFTWQMDPLNTKEMAPVETQLLYTDAEGREWGKVGYWYGSRNIWFCLSDLENPDLPEEDHMPELVPAAASASLPEWRDTAVVLAVLAVAGVCAVTAVLLALLRRKKHA